MIEKIHRKNRLALVSVLFVLLTIAVVVPTAQCDVWDPWHTHAEHVANFKSLADKHGVNYFSVGKSYENNDIWMFEMGDPEDGRVLWDGQLHGNEDFGTEVLYLMMTWLLESGEPRAERILQRNHVLFIPVVNVDAPHRRGNTHFYSESPEYGVDLNRNFKTGWRHGGLHDDEYSGPYAASEPETQAMINVFQTYKPAYYVNLHQGAGPYFSYYRGGDSTLANQVISKAERIAINELSHLHNPQWSGSLMRSGTMGSTGFAIGDAYTVGGASSWLVELDPSWRHGLTKWSELENRMFPQCLAMFIAMCEISEGQPSPEPEPEPEPKPNNPPTISNPNPSDAATDVSISLDQLSFTLEDPDGDSIDYVVTTTPNIGGDSATNKASGTYTVSVSGLSYDTTYTWQVEATDDAEGDSVFETYSFTTESEPEPEPEPEPERWRWRSNSWWRWRWRSNSWWRGLFLWSSTFILGIIMY